MTFQATQDKDYKYKESESHTGEHKYGESSNNRFSKY